MYFLLAPPEALLFIYYSFPESEFDFEYNESSGEEWEVYGGKENILSINWIAFIEENDTKVETKRRLFFLFPIWNGSLISSKLMNRHIPIKMWID